DGVRALRAQPEPHLAYRLPHLEPGRGDLHRQSVSFADAWPRQRRCAAAVSGPAAALVARSRIDNHVARLLPHHGGSYRALVAGSLGAALGIGHDVARAAMDSL